MSEASVAVGLGKGLCLFKVHALGLDYEHLRDALAFPDHERAVLAAADNDSDAVAVIRVHHAVERVRVEAVLRRCQLSGEYPERGLIMAVKPRGSSIASPRGITDRPGLTVKSSGA